MDYNKLLQVATYAGKIMLESGAEIYRVEETISRICYAYNVSQADCFVTPTGILVSIIYDNNTLSIVKRVTNRGVDLNKIDKINDISRTLEKQICDLDELNLKLKKIDKTKRYLDKITLISAIIISLSFTYIYGGSTTDILSGSIIGFIIEALLIVFSKLKTNEFFVNYISAAFGTLAAVLLSYIGISQNIDKTIIGPIMLLVPGLAITTAIRDIIAGDLLSGITKIGEAFIIAIAVAAGSGTVLSLYLKAIA